MLHLNLNNCQLEGRKTYINLQNIHRKFDAWAKDMEKAVATFLGFLAADISRIPVIIRLLRE